MTNVKPSFFAFALAQYFKDREVPFGFYFAPVRSDYQLVGIKQKRFGQLMRNEKSPTTDEAYRFCELLQLDLKEMIKQYYEPTSE